MKILNARVDWMEGFANDPRLEVLVDELPEWGDMRFRERSGLYYAELEGFVNFMYYGGNGENTGGYGGRHFDLKMTNGMTETLRGPWSSRAGCVNRAGFPHCIEVSITDEPDVWERGYTFMAGALTVEKAHECLEYLDGVYLRKEERWDGEIYYVPEKYKEKVA